MLISAVEPARGVDRPVLRDEVDERWSLKVDEVVDQYGRLPGVRAKRRRLGDAERDDPAYTSRVIE